MDAQTLREEWRAVLGYEGCYEVSDLGRVRSLERVVAGGRTPTSFRTVRARFRALNVNKDGHVYVVLHKDRKRKHFFVHRLVLEAFEGERPDGYPEIRHLNGNASDNRLSNLAFGTHAENVADMMQHGTHVNARKTHCIRGHEFTPGNTYLRPDGKGRHCLICMKSHGRANGARYQRNYRAKKAALSGC